MCAAGEGGGRIEDPEACLFKNFPGFSLDFLLEMRLTLRLISACMFKFLPVFWGDFSLKMRLGCSPHGRYIVDNRLYRCLMLFMVDIDIDEILTWLIFCPVLFLRLP